MIRRRRQRWGKSGGKYKSSRLPPRRRCEVMRRARPPGSAPAGPAGALYTPGRWGGNRYVSSVWSCGGCAAPRSRAGWARARAPPRHHAPAAHLADTRAHPSTGAARHLTRAQNEYILPWEQKLQSSGQVSKLYLIGQCFFTFVGYLSPKSVCSEIKNLNSDIFR